MHSFLRPWQALVVLAAAAIGLSACSSQPEVISSSGPRPPTSTEQVKLYQKAPKQYEQLGSVTVSVGEEGAVWDQRGDATLAFDILKRKGAALGANGVLLANEEVGDADVEQRANPDRTHQLVLAGYHGTFYEVPVIEGPRRAVGQAIYVHEEK